MITEDFCSPEVTKLLEEKGFTKDCIRIHAVCNGFTVDSIVTPDAPTHQSAMKWLREVHHYYIQVMLDSWALGGHSGYYIIIQRTDNDFEIMLQDYVNEVFYKTYEEAVEAALKYALENIITMEDRK